MRKRIIRTINPNIYNGLINFKLYGEATINCSLSKQINKILNSFGDTIKIEKTNNIYKIKKLKDFEFDIYLKA